MDLISETHLEIIKEAETELPAFTEFKGPSILIPVFPKNVGLLSILKAQMYPSATKPTVPYICRFRKKYDHRGNPLSWRFDGFQ